MSLIKKLTRGRSAAGAVDTDGISRRSLRFKLQPTADTAIVSTGLKLPPKSVVTRVYVDMASVASAATPLLDVGITTATRGFLAGVNVASIGLARGSSASAAAPTAGTLLTEVLGTGVSGDKEWLSSATAQTEVTYSTRAAATRLEGTVVIEYKQLNS